MSNLPPDDSDVDGPLGGVGGSGSGAGNGSGDNGLGGDLPPTGPGGGGAGRMTDLPIEDELRQSYLTYAMSVIVSERCGRA